MTPGARLRALLARDEPLVMPGAWDCMSARLLQDAGFEAVGVSGAGVSVARLGLPDLGFLGLSDMADTVRAIAANVEVPVLADADTGFGNTLSAIRTVREFTAAGAAGLHIEDQTFPKRCGHLDGKQVISADEYLTKLSAVVQERPDPDFVVIARTDVLAVEGVDAAIDRANRALEVGADVVMIEAVETLEQVQRIGREVSGAKLYNLATGGRGPRLTVAELHGLGFGWIVMPGLAMAGVVDGIRQAAAAALRDGDDEHVAALGFSPQDFFELGGLSMWRELERKYPSETRSQPAWA
ncbi:carboxyvinyl-carboxyphosphonate phosphorylmutase [Acrocarpospora pleiomorpha]|uniref:Carboxyvinyl-carboxyphosphonate phosphorylmutase n=1 Tax=Acrocarpospora pleiomorpha TaxID=90975 RepID=A0A5M3XXB9_9ACTN|nr:oxaloacetate decarboxylase [Acrocarpospora pleiomorpha]GES24709.1 carboxyvinyl-carboxyphosphonate phosphorylmutase [Acrocarpospora pleiomorpha]